MEREIIISKKDAANKYLILADLHFHHIPLRRYNWGEQFLDELKEKFLSQKLKGIFLLGDMFEVGNRLDGSVLNSFLLFIYKCIGKRIPLYWLSGQHDVYKPFCHSLFGLKNLIKIIEKYYKFTDNTYFVSYHYNYNDYREILEMIPQNSILFTHIPVKEFLPISPDKNIMLLSEFQKFKKIISGDIHTGKTKSNFTYVGVPFQRDFREENVKGRILLWDGNELFEEVEIIHPMFLTIKNRNDLEKFLSEFTTTRCYLIRIREGISIPKDIISKGKIEIIGSLPKEIKIDKISEQIKTDTISYQKTMEEFVKGEKKEKALLKIGFQLIKEVSN